MGDFLSKIELELKSPFCSNQTNDFLHSSPVEHSMSALDQSAPKTLCACRACRRAPCWGPCY